MFLLEGILEDDLEIAIDFDYSFPIAALAGFLAVTLMSIWIWGFFLAADYGLVLLAGFFS